MSIQKGVAVGITTVGFETREPTPYAALDMHAMGLGFPDWAPARRSAEAAARLAAVEVASGMSADDPAAPSFIVTGVGSRKRKNTMFQIVRRAEEGTRDPEAKVLIDVQPIGLLISGPYATTEIVEALKKLTTYWQEHANSGDIGAYVARIMRNVGLMPHMGESRIWVGPSEIANGVIRQEGVPFNPEEPTLNDSLVALTGGLLDDGTPNFKAATIALRRSDLMGTPENIRGASKDAMKAILAEVEAIQAEINAKTLSQPRALEARKEKLLQMLPDLEGWRDLLGEKFAELETSITKVAAAATEASLQLILAGQEKKAQKKK